MVFLISRFYALIWFQTFLFLELIQLMKILYDLARNIVLFGPYQNFLGKDETLQILMLMTLLGFPMRVLPFCYADHLRPPLTLLGPYSPGQHWQHLKF